MCMSSVLIHHAAHDTRGLAPLMDVIGPTGNLHDHIVKLHQQRIDTMLAALDNEKAALDLIDIRLVRDYQTCCCDGYCYAVQCRE